MDQLKLSKSFTAVLKAARFTEPLEIQQRMMSRIAGGQNLIGIGPVGCGKTTTYMMHILDRIDYESKDEAPKFLILVPDKARVEGMVERFRALSPRRRDLRIIGLFEIRDINDHVNQLVDGMDIVVATPKQARAVYLKLGLNLSKIKMMVVDDAHDMLKLKMQLPIQELARSIQKTQHLVLADRLDSALEKFTETYIKQFPIPTISVD